MHPKAAAGHMAGPFSSWGLDGRDLRGLPLLDRKERLRRMLDALRPERVLFATHVRGRGVELYRAVCVRFWVKEVKPLALRSTTPRIRLFLTREKAPQIPRLRSAKIPQRPRY